MVRAIADPGAGRTRPRVPDGAVQAPNADQARETAKDRWLNWFKATGRRAKMIAIIAIAWLLAIWAIVISFSVYFSRNLN